MSRNTTDEKSIGQFGLMLKVNDKINKIDNKLERLTGQLDATLPNLVTESSVHVIVKDALDEHRQQCRKDTRSSYTPKSSMSPKTQATIAGAIVGLTTAIYALVQVFG